MVYPEGVIGKPTPADPQKAVPSVEKSLDYLKKLHAEIMTRFPPGQLPESKYMTQRDPKLVKDLLAGPLNGGKHLYVLGFPP